MVFLRGAGLGVLITLAGWSVFRPAYLNVIGMEFVRGNSDYIGPVPSQALILSLIHI